MRILISACLLGACCRYDGKSKECPAALELRRQHELVPVCPEQLGGLPTPRPPCERVGECRTLPLWQGLEDVVRGYLSGVTLRELMLKDTKAQSTDC